MAWQDDLSPVDAPHGAEDDPYYAAQELYGRLPDPWRVAAAELAAPPKPVGRTDSTGRWVVPA